MYRHPYGPGGPPVEPGLELTFPEFDAISLLRMAIAGAGSKIAK